MSSSLLSQQNNKATQHRREDESHILLILTASSHEFAHSSIKIKPLPENSFVAIVTFLRFITFKKNALPCFR